MTQELLMQLVRKAIEEQTMASVVTERDLHLMVYPLDQCMIVGVGIEGERAHALQPKDLLHRRSRDLERYGAWMPTWLDDGSWYVARRIFHVDIDIAPLTQEDLDIAAELLE